VTARPAQPARRRRWPRRVAQAGCGLALLGLLACGGLVAWEWTYFERMWTYPTDRQVTDVDWYKPREVVKGDFTADLPTAAKPGVSADALAAAARYAEAKNSSALVVLHRGEVVAEHYWRGHRKDAVTNSMSMAKTVVGLLVGVAIAEGHIKSVDEPAATYLTEWAGDGRSRITIRHLLRMCSGLANAEHYDDPSSDIGYMYLGTDSLYVVANADLTCDPGTRFDYNSINTQALGFVLERATGRRYAEYLSEKLWRPLAAADASVWLDRPGGAAKCFCCLFATTRDWARLGLLVLNKGRVGDRQVVPAAWVEEMITPSPLEPDYGYHIWLGNRGVRSEDHEEPFAAPGVCYLDGRHKQRVYVVPTHELVIVRVGENARGWDEAVLPNTLVRGLAK
jgi:CubicO group peptidase (beta-lactamase class C family)